MKLKRAHLGDDGYTYIMFGEKIAKEDLLIELIGVLDELNSFIGLARSFSKNEYVNNILRDIQDLLFRMSRDLAYPKSKLTDPWVSERDVENIERLTNDLWEKIPEPKYAFVYPTGTPVTSVIHVARSVCRRGERIASKLYHENRIDRIYLVILNRLSDLLYVLARYNNSLDNYTEEIWRKW
ncbi:MAG: cob(I)yrinic acid a,c-diamide adenosyltransferase [Sulfolobales archaeon]